MASGLVDSLLESVQSLSQMDREQKQQKSMDAYRKQEVALRQQEIEAQQQHAAATTAHTNFLEKLNLDKFFETQQRNDDLAAKAKTDEEGRNTRATAAEAGRNQRADEVNSRVLKGQDDVNARSAASLAERKKMDDARIPKIIADTELAVVKKDIQKRTLEDQVTYQTWRAQHEKNITEQDQLRSKNLKADLSLKGVRMDMSKFELALKQKYAVPKAELDMQLKQIELQRKQGDGKWSENAKRTTSWLEKEYTTANSNYERTFSERAHQIDAQIKTKATVEALSKQKDLAEPDKVLLESQRSKLAELNQRIMMLHGEVHGYDQQRKGYQDSLNKTFGLTSTPLTGSGTADTKRNPKAVAPGGSLPGIKGLGMIPSLKTADKATWLRFLHQTGGDLNKAKVLAAQEGYK
jgi:hypothetical protein